MVGPAAFRHRAKAGLHHLSSFPAANWSSSATGGNHDPFDEWVYNSADIDGSKVVWARDMDAADNLELIRYYTDRKVWLVEPDAVRRGLPYPVPEQAAGARIKSDTALRRKRFLGVGS